MAATRNHSHGPEGDATSLGRLHGRRSKPKLHIFPHKTSSPAVDPHSPGSQGQAQLLGQRLVEWKGSAGSERVNSCFY